MPSYMNKWEQFFSKIECSYFVLLTGMESLKEVQVMNFNHEK